MKLYSTNNRGRFFSLKEAVLKGLPDDNGLFMPDFIPQLSENFFNNIEKYSFEDISFLVCRSLFQGSINENDLRGIIEKSITFPAPLVKLDNEKYVLELFHGPSMAFKDFGARFMAQLMSYFNRDEDTELVILVATSGDTGGAVAAGFYNKPGVKVIILYPSGKVSHLQEKQLTTLGENIFALEVNGTFDDCQSMVKKAFLDKELTSRIRLTSANSINIARLIPQSFYYFEAFKQINPGNRDGKKVVFSVPCGNFGNLSAGVFAKKMGLPIDTFIAATNLNDIVPNYLASGIYKPKPSISTLSNAMDVGNPSNFTRLEDLHGFTWNKIKENVCGFSFNDEETKEGIVEMFSKYGYEICPHGAISYLALKEYQEKHSNTIGVNLATAHPSKFLDDVEGILEKNIEIPERLSTLSNREKHAIYMDVDFSDFKEYLIENHL